MRKLSPIEKRAETVTKWVGSPASIVSHTLFFGGAFLAAGLGMIALDRMLLILTTLVSLEAIYLAIFIQMTVNRQSDALAEVEQDIDDIQEDLDEIGEEMDEIIDDMEELDEEGELDNVRKLEQKETLKNIYDTIQKLAGDIENLKK